MPHTSNRVEAAKGNARGIGRPGAEHSPAQGVTLGSGVCTPVVWAVGFALALWLTAAPAYAQLDDATLQAVLALNEEGDRLRSEGRLDEAIAKLDEGLALLVAAVGEANLEVATLRFNQAILLEANGNLDGALLAYAGALASTEAVAGLEHPELIEILEPLGRLHKDRGELDDAVQYYQRLVLIAVNHFGPSSEQAQNGLTQLFHIYYDQGDTPNAVEAGELLLVMLRSGWGADARKLAVAMGNLAIAKSAMGRNDEAEALHKEALAALEDELGPDAPEVALALNGLAVHYQGLDRYEEALPLLVRSLALTEMNTGPDSVEVAVPTHNLGSLYHDLGQFDEAEVRYLRALALWSANLGDSSVRVADAANSLGTLYQDKGDLALARQYYERALAIRRTQGDEHPSVADTLNNLAELERSAENWEQSRTLYGEALAIWSSTLGARHPRVALGLGNLALTEEHLGALDDAWEHSQQALDILGEVYGEGSTQEALVRHNRAALLWRRGDLEGADREYAAAQAIWERTLGPEDPDLAALLDNRAALKWAAGDPATALELHTKAMSIREKNLERMLVIGDDSQKLATLAQLEVYTHGTLSLFRQEFPDDPEVMRLAFESVLSVKGRALEATARHGATLRTHLDEASRTALDALTAIKTQLARAALAAEVDAEATEALMVRARELEAQLGVAVSGLVGEDPSPTLGALAAALPPQGLLLEYVMFRPYTPAALMGWERAGDWRYAVFALNADGELSWHDLGPAAAIDEVATRFRTALQRCSKEKCETVEEWTADAAVVRGIGHELFTVVVAPIGEPLNTAAHLLISPDGALALVPFDALVDEGGRYLLQLFATTYLSSGAELVRPRREGSGAQEVVVLGDPDYDEAGADALVAMSETRSAVQRREADVVARELSGLLWPRLPGTAEEVRAIGELFDDAQVLTGSSASEANLKALHGPKILHIATHGFFLGEDGAVGAPLLRSGLALAGANGVSAEMSAQMQGEDGLLTAMEASSLDLWGTRLVVLSACDTGVGELVAGQGVMGLRRALALAGAESEVMSLWQVSDRATQRLFTGTYEGIAAGESRAYALRRAQMEMLSEGPYFHPYFWSAFIFSGDWRPLDETRTDRPERWMEIPRGGCACAVEREASLSSQSWALWSVLALGVMVRLRRK
ncbi:MAG: hypothetical protein CO108_16220 [Deltaproteobacteria bacterium CG_4_9_14_3_um_filter_63_12]|nr:MAG: hypothetical protein CO108_16220 [Deltaproteobacteria bacterium CG_4_9_14_3_um_filter_63_12]